MQPTPEEQAIITAAETAARELIWSLARHESRTLDKYDYYNADNDTRDYGIAMPNQLKRIRPGVGWAGRAVNILSDRVVFDGFANDTFGINDLFDSINALPVINKAKHDAMVAGCAFVAVADRQNEDGTSDKILMPFTALEATGIVDQNTGLLKMGLAVTKWAKPKGPDQRRWLSFMPKNYILFTPQFTAVFESQVLTEVIPNPTSRTLLMPIIRRPSADRPLGKARISNVVRRIVNEVVRVKRRYEVAGEFYSIPQRYINGLAEGAQKDENLDSAIGKLWAITKDEDGEKPDIGQLAQMEISQFETAKKDLARDFCAETALTLRNLGYESGNPTSADSLEAMSDDLVLEAQTAQNDMGEQIKQIAITLRLAIDANDQIPAALKAIVPAWKPIFRVNIGEAGDAMFKLFQAMPELVGTLEGYQMMGVSMRQAEQLQKRRAAASSSSFMNNGGGGA
jgi:hypothetical protein